MRGGLNAGDEAVVTFRVGKEMVAAFEGRTIHNVLSTFTLVYYAEFAARKLLEPYLESEEDAVGGEINLRHLLPSGVGDDIRVTATLESVEGRKVVCAITGMNGARTICTGTQTQFIIPRGALDVA